MGLSAFLLSYLSVGGVALLVVGVPFLLVYPRYFGIPRVYCLLSVMGVYVTLFYVKPAELPLLALPLIVWLIAFLIPLFLRGAREPVLQCLKEPLVWGILVYAFALFLFRWEPPGSEPTRWGAIARILFETGVIPGEPTSRTSIRDLRGLSLGLPLMMALNHLWRLAPLERIVSFYECFSVAAFAFCLASALTPWFSRRAGLAATLVSLGAFTYPQHALAWGGTTMLLGMTGGLCFLEVTKTLLIRRLARREIILFAFAFVFAAHAHLIGFCVSMLVCVPIVAWLIAGSDRRSILLEGVGAWLVFCSLLSLPFLLRWRLAAPPEDLAEFRLWQERMAPHLFAPTNGILKGLFLQLRSFVWEPALAASFFAFLTAAWLDGSKRFFAPFLFGIGICLALLLNARLWWLPFSFLFSPEAVAAFLIFPLSIPIGWIAGHWDDGRSAWASAIFGLLLIMGVGLAGWQFSTRLYPLLFRSRMTSNDLETMRLIEGKVPWEDCIEIKSGEAGMWLPVLALRCTVVASDAGRVAATPTNWIYVADKEETLPLMGGELVIDHGAKLVRRR